MRKKIQTIADLKGARVTVMGLGAHGGAIGNIKWLHRQKAQLVVTDLKTRDELTVGLKEISGQGGIELVLGKHRNKDFIDTDLVLRNPAVPRQSPYLGLARRNGIPVEMDSSLFFKWFDKKRIIGVTGSKGKSTTTMAIGALLKIKMIGLEGTAPLPVLDQLLADERVVFELSSWRLEALDEQRLSPGIGVVTSIYRDHLNTYRSWEEYIDTKKAIVRHQERDDVVLLNLDDEKLRGWVDNIASQVVGYATIDHHRDGIFLQRDQVVVRHQKQIEVIMAGQDIPVRYEHERRNVLPAIYLAWQRGMTKTEMRTAMKKIRLLPHRMESVAVIGGVEYINDSAATMPDATIAALGALSQRKIIHILGGNDKALDFSRWAEVEAKADVKQLIWLPGSASEKMKREYLKAGGQQRGQVADNMVQAVRQAAYLAEPGEVVLLSPGATSFGLFRHEFDRGNQFKAAVNHLLKEERGAV